MPHRASLRRSISRHALGCALLAPIAATSPAAAQTVLTDHLVFGDPASEAAHALEAGRSGIVRGGLGLPARVLQPSVDQAWKSDDLPFRLRIDPERVNYLSARLWGGDVNPNKLVLRCDGKQIGYRHLGDTEILDLGASAPTYAGRFTYRTFALPQSLTRGKATLDCQLRALGPFAVYNNRFDRFQKPMEGNARPVYALYVHSEPFLDTGEVNGAAPAAAPTRPSPGADVMEQVKSRVTGEIARLLAATRPLTQDEMHFLARAYEADWTPAYRNRQVAQKIVAGGDALYARFLENPDFALTPEGNASWIAFGPFGKALRIAQADIRPLLDTTIAGRDGGPVTRRAAYEAMLARGLDFLVHNRRLYTNQSMIVDLLGIYFSNEGLRAVESARAWPESRIRPFLYESVGLLPWSGSLGPDGRPTYSSSARDSGTFRLPSDYHIFTPAGLSREFGFVGGYGEIQDLAANIYLATVPAPGKPGDPKLLAQFLKIAHARQAFRYPILDRDGYRSMALERNIGWRDPEFPGMTTYVQRMGWDNSPLFIATVTRDPALRAAARQMLDDNQYYVTVQDRLANKGQRVTFSLFDVYAEWLVARSWGASDVKLPMTSGQPDFVFSDPQNAVIALKNGDDILYASLYWRAHCGVNRLMRIHYMTPQTERTATVQGRIDFEPSGQTCRRDSSPQAFTGAPLFDYPDDVPVAGAGDELPIAKGPAEARFTGKNNPFGGRGDYYETRYGPYLLAINANKAKTVQLELPRDGKPMTDLVTRQRVPAGARSMTVAPGQTVVLYSTP